MAKQQPKGDLRGLVIPARAFADASYTASTQASPYAGPVVPDQVTGLVLHSSGDLDTALPASQGDTLELETLNGGNVGDAALRWRFLGESMRSWEPPLLQSGWEFIARSTVASRYRHPHAVRRAKTGLLAVAVIYNDSDVRVYTQSKYGKWTSSTVASVGSTTRASLMELPSGRLVCIYTVPSGSARTQVRSAYSDDDGATWTTGNSAGFESGLEYACSDVLRIRVSMLNGQVLLLVWVQYVYDFIIQYSSNDGGNNFSFIEMLTPVQKSHPDICVMGGSLYVAYIGYDSSAGSLFPYVRKLASCSQPLSSAFEVSAEGGSPGTAAPGTWTGLTVSAGDCTIAASDEGLLYMFTTDFGTAGTNPRETLVRISTDAGKTWSYNHRNSHGYSDGANIAYSGSAAACFRDLHAVPERGRMVLFHSPQTNPGGVATNFTSLCASYLGGWTTVPLADPSGARFEIAGWDWTYTPFDLPADMGATWATTLTGAATQAIGSDGLTITVAVPDTLYYSTAPVTTGYEDQGMVSEFHVLVTTGSVRAEMRISNGVNDYTARLVFGTAQIALIDANAGTTIATLAIDCTVGVVVRFALDKSSAGGWAANVGRVKAWAREDGPYTGAVINHGPRQDRVWTQIGTSSTLQAGVQTTNLLRFGKTVVGTAGTATFRGVFWSAGRETGGNITTGSASRGHIVPAVGSPMHLTQGYRVAGIDGPTVGGDTFQTAAAWEYPASAINPFVSPSPRRRWRSTRDNVAEDITISGVDLGAFGGDLWACYVAGANWRTATLYRDTGAVNKLLDRPRARPHVAALHAHSRARLPVECRRRVHELDLFPGGRAHRSACGLRRRARAEGENEHLGRLDELGDGLLSVHAPRARELRRGRPGLWDADASDACWPVSL